MSRSRVIVEYPDRPAYAVRIGGGLAAQLGADLRALCGDAARCLAVCDPESAVRGLPALKESLAQAGFRVADITVPSVGPDQSWACVAELHRALAQLELPVGSPIIVHACAQVAEVVSFAASTYGAEHPLVLVPASLASAYRTVGVSRFEFDAGYPVPVAVRALPSFACIDTALLACSSSEEEGFGLDELSACAAYCDAAFDDWYEQNIGAIERHDEEPLVLALTQTLAARADAIGQGIRERLR